MLAQLVVPLRGFAISEAALMSALNHDVTLNIIVLYVPILFIDTGILVLWMLQVVLGDRRHICFDGFLVLAVVVGNEWLDLQDLAVFVVLAFEICVYLQELMVVDFVLDETGLLEFEVQGLLLSLATLSAAKTLNDPLLLQQIPLLPILFNCCPSLLLLIFNIRLLHDKRFIVMVIDFGLELYHVAFLLKVNHGAHLAQGRLRAHD